MSLRATLVVAKQSPTISEFLHTRRLLRRRASHVLLATLAPGASPGVTRASYVQQFP
jgi:hypothetical protein